ncbi:MAG TPA: hypothetical protein VGI98_02180 [Candidatus Limnocylindrales bacterium]
MDARQEPRPTSETPRSRHFSLPRLDDPRTDEAIDALLAGAERKRGRPAPEPLPITGRAAFDGLESRMAWMDALRREDARQQRYRHAASIVVFEARALTETDVAGDWLGRIAGPIAHTVRRAARATDRVTRASETRFMVLLPETSEADAAHYAERVLGDCAIWLNAMHAPVAVRASAAAASSTSERSLEDALARAIDALAAGLPTGIDLDDDIDWESDRRPPRN